MSNAARHVMANEATREFVCTHCGGTYSPSLPGPLELYVDLRRLFVIDHKHCVPRETTDLHFSSEDLA